jgi:hypothetical protein
MPIYRPVLAFVPFASANFNPLPAYFYIVSLYLSLWLAVLTISFRETFLNKFIEKCFSKNMG